MPQIPRIVQNQPLQPGKISVGAAAAPGEALAQFGERIANIGLQMAEKQHHLRQLNDYTQRSTAVKLEIDAAVREEMANPDFRSAPDRIDKRIQKISKLALDSVNDPQVKADLTSKISSLYDHEIINARDYERTSEIKYGRSVFDASLDASRNRLATLTGVEYDKELSDTKALAIAQVNAGLYNPDDMQKIMDGWQSGIAEDHARINGVSDPVSTINELVDGKSYNALNPSQRLRLAAEILSGNEKRNSEARAARENSQEIDHTRLTELGAKGQLTHSMIDGVVGKWNDGGKPFEAAWVEHLHEMVDKPANELPTPVALKDIIDHGMSPINPTITQDELWQLRQLGPERGGLSHTDYNKYSDELGARQRYLLDKANSQVIAQGAIAMSIIDSKYGADPQIRAEAINRLSQTMRYGGSGKPLDILPGLSKDFDQEIERLGGLSVVGAVSQFNSVRGQYLRAIDKKRKLEESWMNVHIKNPLTGIIDTADSNIADLKADMINKAKAADLDLGPAPKNAIDGSEETLKKPIRFENGRVFPAGTTVIYINGRVIPK